MLGREVLQLHLGEGPLRVVELDVARELLAFLDQRVVEQLPDLPRVPSRWCRCSRSRRRSASRRRHRDPPPAHHLRPVPLLPGRRGDALHQPRLPRRGRHQRRHGRVPLTGAGSAVKLDPSLQPADIAALADAGLTAYHAVKKAILLLPGHDRAGHRGRRARPHRCPVAAGPDRGDHHRGRPQSGRARAGGRLWGRPHGGRRRQPADTVGELTSGLGAEVVFDFVGEQGAENEGWDMTRRGGSHYVIGYGGTVTVPTIDIISTERNVIGNLVGTYNDLAS